VRTKIENKRFISKVLKAADQKNQITMAQMVNLFNSQGRKTKSSANTYLRMVFIRTGALKSVKRGVYTMGKNIGRYL